MLDGRVGLPDLERGTGLREDHPMRLEDVANAPRVGEYLFISRRTVETHVAHIFTKVGVSNRSKLEAAYVRR